MKRTVQKCKDIKVLMLDYHIRNLRHHREMQLLAFMYKESRIVENLSRKTTSIVVCSDCKIKLIEKLTRKTTVQKSPYFRCISLQKEKSLLKFKRQLRITFPDWHARNIHTTGGKKRILLETVSLLVCMCNPLSQISPLRF